MRILVKYSSNFNGLKILDVQKCTFNIPFLKVIAFIVYVFTFVYRLHLTKLYHNKINKDDKFFHTAYTEDVNNTAFNFL